MKPNGYAGETRPSPSATEAEQALLGAILVNNSTYARVAGIVQPDHFGHAVHGRIFTAIGAMIERGAVADPITLKAAVDHDPAFTAPGAGARYVADLVDSAVSIINAPHYGAAIRDAALRRALIEAGEALIEGAHAPDVPIETILPEALRRLPQSDMTGDGLDVTCAADLADIEAAPRPWLVPDWIPLRQVTLLSGDGGGGKSQLGLQLQAAASAGRDWLGLPVTPCRSLGLYAEDDQDELHRRLRGIVDLMGLDAAGLCDMHWRSVVGESADLIEIDERGAVRPTAYYRRVERTALGFKARLLILDALANFYGGDEIRRRQVNAFLGLLRELAVKMDGAVVLLAHPSLAGINSGSGLSGSTHWNNAVRSRLYLTRTTGEDADPDERELTRLKANYAGAGDVLRLRWQRGGFVALDAPTGIDRAALGAKADRVFRALLAATYAEGSWTSPNPAARNYAPSMFAKHPDREGLGKPAFEAAMRRLMKAGGSKVEAYGPPSQDRKRLAPA